MLPEAVSEALGISLSKILDLYFRGTDKVRRNHVIEEAIERRREDEQYEENQRREAEEERRLELQSYYEDTTF
jgi:hypothetical protein